MLVSRDLLKFLSRDLSPAQLCLMRVIGSDMEYVLRVRYKDVYLDYPWQAPSLTEYYDFEEMHDKLVAMARLVVPPDADQYDKGWCPSPEPAILAPQSPGKFHYEW